MTSTLPIPALSPAAPIPGATGERFVFRGVDWDFYETVLRTVEGRRAFVTYYRGTLEMMTTSFEHDAYAEMLALLVRTCAQSLKLPHKGAGSTTFRRRLADAGLEPDRCFYLQNVRRIRGKRTIDLETDPPPDLAIEVEIGRRLAERVQAYEALGVQELWRCDRRRLRVFVLGADGRYEESDRSAAFPTLPPDQVHRFLEMGWGMDEVEWVAAIQKWIKQQRRKPVAKRRRKR